jgi:3-oxoacyl-[acyl-carrier protein] reductase
VAADNVLVNTVGPGWTRTDRVTQMLASRAAAGAQSADAAEAQIVRTVPIARLGEPAEIADAIVFLASERASFISGTLLQVDGGVVQSPT